MRGIKLMGKLAHICLVICLCTGLVLIDPAIGFYAAPGGAGATSPGGVDKNIQYNNASSFGGIANNATATPQYLQQKNGGTASFQQVQDADLNVTDVTTNNVSTTAHGFTPKAPNDATKFLNGTGVYSVPAGSGTGLDGTRGLKVVPANPVQGTVDGISNVFTQQSGTAFYQLFSGSNNSGYLISSPVIFTAFNVVVSVTGSPGTVVYETCQSGTWTSVTPTVTAVYTALGYSQTTGIPTTNWTTGACGTTNAPAGNFNLRIRETVGVATPSGRISLAEAVDVTIDEVIMSAGSVKTRYTSVSATVNITQANVVNGRDQAGAFTANTFIFLWGTGGGANFHGLWSVSSTAPTLQGGDTAKVLLGGYRVDANVLLLPWSQSGNLVTYASPIKDSTGFAGTSATAVTVTLPSIAKAWLGAPSNSGNAIFVNINDVPFLASNGVILSTQYAEVLEAVGRFGIPGRIRLTIAQTIYAYINGSTVDIYTSGYEMSGALN